LNLKWFFNLLFLNLFQRQPSAERDRDWQRLLPAAAVLPLGRLHHKIKCQVTTKTQNLNVDHKIKCQVTKNLNFNHEIEGQVTKN
jgi:hypothetical protein